MLLVAALGAWGYLTEHNRASDARMDLARTRSQLRVQSAVARRLVERQSDSEAAFDAHLRRLQRRIRELEHPRLARIGTQVRLPDGPFSVPLWMLAPYDAFITNGRPLAAWGSIPP